ncbi:hypothetical protein [Sulfitobacter pontiacus]|uniref:hypothetical protein n=1 Tax=Sulfitobacter pontiacus TaxID=60137 RepID=UPI000A702482|nr:hypothetical protein [Sulfitobacter pontiacus]
MTNIPAHEIERLLHHMPSVAIHAKNPWIKSFAQSVTKQARRKGWQPSPKQLSIMRGLVSDLFAYGCDEGGDIQLIE